MREVILGAGFHGLAAPMALVTASIELGVWQPEDSCPRTEIPPAKKEKGALKMNTHTHTLSCTQIVDNSRKQLNHFQAENKIQHPSGSYLGIITEHYNNIPVLLIMLILIVLLFLCTPSHLFVIFVSCLPSYTLTANSSELRTASLLKVQKAWPEVLLDSDWGFQKLSKCSQIN